MEDESLAAQVADLTEEVGTLTAEREEANDDLEIVSDLLRRLKTAVVDARYAAALETYLERRISDARSALSECADRLHEIREELQDAAEDFEATQEQTRQDFVNASRELTEALSEADKALTR